MNKRNRVSPCLLLPPPPVLSAPGEGENVTNGGDEMEGHKASPGRRGRRDASSFFPTLLFFLKAPLFFFSARSTYSLPRREEKFQDLDGGARDGVRSPGFFPLWEVLSRFDRLWEVWRRRRRRRFRRGEKKGELEFLKGSLDPL